MENILDDLQEENKFGQQERHGCVTAWLILMIVANIISAISYFFLGDAIVALLPSQPPLIMLLAIGFLAIINVVFAVMLFQWKKIGFYGFVVTSILAFGLNIFMGIGISQSLPGLLGFVLLYAIFQIKNKAGKSAWENLS